VTFDPFGDFATEGYLRNFELELNSDKSAVYRLAAVSAQASLAYRRLYRTESRCDLERRP
jgi:hypothetical protein